MNIRHTDPEMTNFLLTENVNWSIGFNDRDAIWNKQSDIDSKLESGYPYNVSCVWRTQTNEHRHNDV